MGDLENDLEEAAILKNRPEEYVDWNTAARVNESLAQTAHDAKRDRFAGLAMQGILAGNQDWIPASVATAAYEMADAMLEARKKSAMARAQAK